MMTTATHGRAARVRGPQIHTNHPSMQWPSSAWRRDIILWFHTASDESRNKRFAPAGNTTPLPRVLWREYPKAKLKQRYAITLRQRGYSSCDTPTGSFSPALLLLRSSAPT